MGDCPFIYRAGVWKPRTSPATFQGAGLPALSWLQRVKRELFLPVATEVATVEQVQAAVQAQIDYLWIGARTCTNPIAVQQLADALQGCKGIQGIFIKNPMHEDAALWLGNIQRLEATHMPVIPIHRGCNHRPCWEMAYTLHQQRPDLPLMIDASHLCGQREGIAAILDTAQTLHYSGAMLEVHTCPEQALSDAQQQVTPAQAAALVAKGDEARRREGDEEELLWLRAMIDETDDALWEMISHRMDICRQIGEYKRHHHMPVLQPQRFEQILERRIKWSQHIGLSPDAVTTMMKTLHTESVRVQS